MKLFNECNRFLILATVLLFSVHVFSKNIYDEYLEILEKKQTNTKSVSVFSNLLNSAQKETKTHPIIERKSAVSFSKFTIENVCIDKKIPGNLYLPKTQERCPAILFLCGHEKQSKATESYQLTAQLLAANGFVVLVTDPISQGERCEKNNRNQPKFKLSTTEHTLLNMSYMLFGETVAAHELEENKCCLNALLSLTEVDSTRVGAIGNSGGGAQVSYLSFSESRLRATACCSWFTNRFLMMKTYGMDDGCQYNFNEFCYGFDIYNLYERYTPRPLLILSGKKDFILYDGAKIGFEKLQKVYQSKNKTENLEWVTIDDGHGISAPKREATLRFFTKHLTTKKNYLTEEKLNLMTVTENQLRFFNEDYSVKIAENFFLHKYKDTENNRKKFKLQSTVNQNKIIKSLLGKKSKIHLKIQKFSPDKSAKELCIILNDNDFTDRDFATADSLKKLGYETWLTDITGTGIFSDEKEKNNPKFWNNNYRLSALLLALGKNLVGEQCYDILEILQKTKKFQSIKIYADGNVSISALHAIFLFGRKNISLIEKNSIRSWKEIFNFDTAKNRIDVIIPNALNFYDLEDLRNLHQQ